MVHRGESNRSVGNRGWGAKISLHGYDQDRRARIQGMLSEWIPPMIASYIAMGLSILGLVAVVWAGVTDFRTFLIPNWLSATILVLGVAFGLFVPDFPWLANFLAALLVFAIGFLFFSIRLFGGGDVKLMTAITFWCGFGELMSFALVTALFGGILSLGYVLKAYWCSRKSGEGLIDKLMTMPVPYGIAIAVGGIYVFLRIQVQTGIVL